MNFFQLIDCDNVYVSAFKRAEYHNNKYIIRLCEQKGEESMAVVKFNKDILKFECASVTNGLEQDLADIPARPPPKTLNGLGKRSFEQFSYDQRDEQ
jgi:alpha-mannosidase